MVKGGDRMSEKELIEMLRREIRRAILVYVLFWSIVVIGIVFFHYCIIKGMCFIFLR